MKKQVKPGKASARTAPDDLYVRKTIQIFPGFKESKLIDVDAGISEEIKHTMIRESLVEEIGKKIGWDNFKRINTWMAHAGRFSVVAMHFREPASDEKPFQFFTRDEVMGDQGKPVETSSRWRCAWWIS